MRSMTCACVLLAVFGSVVLEAGQIYGTIVSEGQGIKSANVEITCGTNDPVTGTTGADGGCTASTCHSRASARSRCRAIQDARPPPSSRARIRRSTTSTW